MDNPFKLDDLGGTPIFGNIHMTLGFHVHFPGCSDSELKKDMIFWTFWTAKKFWQEKVFFVCSEDISVFVLNPDVCLPILWPTSVLFECFCPARFVNSSQ